MTLKRASLTCNIVLTLRKNLKGQQRLKEYKMVDWTCLLFDTNKLVTVAILERILNQEILMTITLILLAGLLLVVIAVYSILYQKKRNHFKIDGIKKQLEPLLSSIIIEDSMASKKILAKLASLIREPLAKQLCIDELIQCKQNYSGEAGEKMVHLYSELELKNISLKKIKPNKPWYSIARGIQELYLMEQRDCYDSIMHYANSKHDFVRMEAQIGVLHLIGFKGLKFLDYVSFPLTEWQQMKLLEQLKLFPEKTELNFKISEWLNSKNETVIVFALRLLEEYQQLGLTNTIHTCLYHSSSQVRTQSLKTLIGLEDNDTPSLLLSYFKDASFQDKIIILDALKTMATEFESEKLEALLDDNDNTIKLKAASALVSSSKNGIHILKERSIQQPIPFQGILQHIISMS